MTSKFLTYYFNIIVDAINKILSRDSNYSVDVVMWPRFANSTISLREVLNLNFIRIWPQNPFFLRGLFLVQGQLFETGTRYGLKVLRQCGKRVKNKSQKVLGVNSYVCRSYRGKTGGGLFAALPPFRIGLT